MMPDCYVCLVGVQGVGLYSKGECSEPHFAIITPMDVVHMRTVSVLSPNGGDGPLAVRLPRAANPRQRRRWQQTAAAAGVSESGFGFGWVLLLLWIETQNSPDARAARSRARPLSVSSEGWARVQVFTVILRYIQTTVRESRCLHRGRSVKATPPVAKPRYRSIVTCLLCLNVLTLAPGMLTG